MKLLKRLSFSEKMTITKQLGTMMKAGIPITDALDTLSKQAESDYAGEILSEVQSDIQNGKPLSQSLNRFEKTFGKFYISLVALGEDSGTLEENLNFLSKQLAKSYRLRKKIQTALLYPGLVVIATFILGAFISLFILPQLVGFFEALDVELPLATKILLAVARFMQNYGLLFFGALIGLAVLIVFALRHKKIKRVWDAFILKIPFVNRFIKYGEIAKFSRNLGILLESGVDISQGLEVASSTLSNTRVQTVTTRARDSVLEGGTISEAFRDEGYIFPPMVITMINTGEKSGNLDGVLLYLGDYYEEEIDGSTENVTSVLEPLLLIFIGLVVGFVALAIIGPIYELSGSVGI